MCHLNHRQIEAIVLDLRLRLVRRLAEQLAETVVQKRRLLRASRLADTPQHTQCGTLA